MPAERDLNRCDFVSGFNDTDNTPHQERCDAHTKEHSDEGSECPYCGEQPDYCQGHGEIGDPDGYAYLQSLNEETS